MKKKPQRPLADYKKDISYGIWFCLHQRAALADYDGTYEEYEKLFRHLCKVMGCECETHCLEMLQKHKVKTFLNMRNREGTKIGCLYHSWMCHNEVNLRLGKKMMSFEEVEPLYIYKQDYKTCEAPSNIDDLSNKFPGLIKKTPTPNTNTNVKSGKKFQLIKVS